MSDERRTPRPGDPRSAWAPAGRSPGAAWGLLAVVVLAIVFLSLAPVPDPDLPGALEHLPHAAAYFTLTFVLLTAALRRSDRIPWVAAGAIACVLAGVGVMIELAQRLVGRDVDEADAIANAVGIAAATGVWLLARALRRGARTTSSGGSKRG